MADTADSLVTITVDEVPYQVPKGMLLIDAITEVVGFDMPRFCHHERLVPVGMCRQCMAEVEARGRWANVATCTIRVADGMQVRVHSPAAEKARRMTIELLLVDHPLDCPICDKGGECMLQDQTVAHGTEVARTVEPRRKWPKPFFISDEVVLDRERCVRCARCTRFVDEIAGEPTIELINRGARTEVGTALAGRYDGHFTGNTCDICPVGALTSSTFRFRSRPWEMENRPVISPFTADGTNLYLSVRENVVRRALPRENAAVNDLWCSDKDRFDHSLILSPQRLDVPLVRNPETGQLEPATFEDALAAAADGLAKVVSSGGAVAGFGGTVLSCEEQYALQKLVRVVLGSNSVSTGKLLDLDERAALAPTYAALEQGKTFLIVGPNVVGELPNAWLRIYKALRFHGASLLTVGNQDYFVSLAGRLHLHCQPGAEALVARGLLAWLQAEKKHDLGTIRSRTTGFSQVSDSWRDATLDQVVAEAGVDREQFLALAERLTGAEDLVVVAPQSDGRADGTAARDALWNLALALGVPRMEHGGFLEPLLNCNTRGALDMGLRPDLLPGCQPVADDTVRARFASAWGATLPAAPGLGSDGVLAAAEAGELGGLLICGSDWVDDRGNPFQNVRNRWLNQGRNGAVAAQLDAGAVRRRAALERVGFVVVTELFDTATVALADVVLPATCYAERAGTYVSAEGRVQFAPAAVRPILGVRSDLDILNALAQRLAAALHRPAWQPLTPATAWDEVTALSPVHAAATRAVLAAGDGVVVTPPVPGGKLSFVAL